MTTPGCFQASVHWVLQREGVRWDAAGNLVATGLVDNPKDAGKVTNFGIASRWHPGVDVRNLTLTGAIQIYRTEYWDKFKCELLSDPWALFVFDSAVQHPPSAVMLFEQFNNICDAMARRRAFYLSLNEPEFEAGWLTRWGLLKDRLLSEYGVACP